MSDEHETVAQKLIGRRRDDKINAAILAVALLGWPTSLWFIQRDYADIPKELQQLREDYLRESTRTQGSLNRLTEITTDQTEALKSLLPLRERISLVEQEQKQIAAELARHDKRLVKIEETTLAKGIRK